MYDFRDENRAELCSAVKEETTYDLGDEYSSRSSSSSNNILLDDLISEDYDDFSGVQSVPYDLGYGVDWLSEFFSNDPAMSDNGIPINVPISNLECADAVFPMPSFVPINARGSSLDSVSKFKQEEELFMDSSCYLPRQNPINSTSMVHNGTFLAKSIIDNDNHIEDIVTNGTERRPVNNELIHGNNELIHGNSTDMFTNQTSNQQNVMLLAREAAHNTLKLIEPNLAQNDLLGNNDDNFDNDFDENMGICNVAGDLPSNPPLLTTHEDKISERCANSLLKILPRRGLLHDSVLQGAIKIEEDSIHEVDSGYESPASYSSFSPSFISCETGSSCETLHYIDIPPQERIPFYLSDEEKKTLVTEGFTVPTGLPLSKIEEKALKKVRRKIKNKISAQESRRKKKEYLELLERRVENFAKDNSGLKKKISGLEMNNRSLLLQVQKLQAMLNSKSGTSKASQTSGEEDLAG